MNPLRLLLLAALAYVVWRLLRRQLRDRIQAELLQQQKEQEKDEATEDMLVEDPACGILIPKQQAVRLRQDGRTYYFCSESCCDAFTSGTKGQDE
ncbi:MAG: YHS domain-containing protein [Candidatus Electronema sp. V4]|uniref:YHS domain-containing protein n=1 Tax=Candidatus Electronema sp. V4 TaxID=3454756 RepID=UPI00405589AB